MQYLTEDLFNDLKTLVEPDFGCRVGQFTVRLDTWRTVFAVTWAYGMRCRPAEIRDLFTDMIRAIGDGMWEAFLIDRKNDKGHKGWRTQIGAKPHSLRTCPIEMFRLYLLRLQQAEREAGFEKGPYNGSLYPHLEQVNGHWYPVRTTSADSKAVRLGI